jgi:transposase
VTAPTRLPRWAGVAPIPASSGRTDLTGCGNRQLKAAIHRIAIAQLSSGGPRGQTYYRRDVPKATVPMKPSALNRRIARAGYQQLKLAVQPRQIATTAAV